MFDNSKEVDRWFADGGDAKYRFDYDLNNESVVFDLGGYKGTWSQKIKGKFDCKIYVFEPIKNLSEGIKSMFLNDSNIHVYDYGLSNDTKTEEISLLSDGSSVFLESKNKEKINLVSVVDFINDNNIDRIDLMKLNIEGVEYDVLEALIESNLIDIVYNIQVQFHNFVDDAENRRDNIRAKLSEKFNETYCYKFVWENWTKK